MKKTPLFLIAMSAIALASCSEDEPVSVRQATNEAISFRPAMGTRASETTNANLDKIFVTAVYGDSTLDSSTSKMSGFKYSMYFDNTEFDKGADSFFTAANGKEYTWLAPDQQINFFAYSPSQDDLGADIIMKEDNTGMTLESFAVPENIADQVDFITANASGTRKINETSGVELTFDHRLAQIELRAKSENDNYTYKVIGARIGRPQYMGTFDFNTNEWTLDDWHDTAVYTSACDTTTLSSTPVSIMGADGNAMLMPQTLTPWDSTGDPDNVAREAYLSVLVNITRTDNGMQIYPFADESKYTFKPVREYGWASIPLSGTWEQGKKYIYTLDFTNGAGCIDPDDPNPGTKIIGGPIKFTVKVNDWVETNSDKVYDMNADKI
ncbi:MAG: fimbrillin family protein [Muribaculaceae bacterium]|nr:fimbrillin family protein [Muribaculaceae bacterium]MDE7097364.1 fimbrillin family protein [Muribaculaceae bacterium]